MTEENDKKDLENMREKLNENIKKILNSEFGGEWDDIINPTFMERSKWFAEQESPVPHTIQEMFEEMMGSSVDKNTETLITSVKAWRNLLLAKQVKDGGETFSQETVDAIGLVMGMTILIIMLKEELE